MPLKIGAPIPPEDWKERTEKLDVDQLYRTQGPRLTRFYARWAGREDIFDLVQESFRRLLGALGTPDVRLDNPEAYLHRVAGNILRDRSRSAREKAASAQIDYQEEMIADRDPHDHLENRDMLARIDAALARMKPKTREIFMLHRLDGLSYAEIADKMGMSVKGVEYQLAKALDDLRYRVGRR